MSQARARTRARAAWPTSRSARARRWPPSRRRSVGRVQEAHRVVDLRQSRSPSRRPRRRPVMPHGAGQADEDALGRCRRTSASTALGVGARGRRRSVSRRASGGSAAIRCDDVGRDGRAGLHDARARARAPRPARRADDRSRIAVSRPSSSVSPARSIAARAGGRGDRAPPARRLDDRDLQLGLPAELPQLVEGAALARDRLGLGPGRSRAGAAGGRDGCARGRSARAGRDRASWSRRSGFERSRLCSRPGRAAAGRRASRAPRRAPRRPPAVARRSAAAPSSPPQSTAWMASFSSAQAGIGQPAQRGQRLGEPDGFDHAGRRRVEVLARAGVRRRAYHPAERRLVRGASRGAGTSRATSRRRRSRCGTKAATRSTGSRSRSILVLGRPFRSSASGLRRTELGEHRGVPGAADDGDPLAAPP